MSGYRAKVLFVCSRNRRRSLTAETIFKGSPRWDVRSVGTEEAARVKVTPGHLGWADVVVVMEKRHKERLFQKFPEAMANKSCVCFFIPDEFEYMDEQLISQLQSRMEEHFGIESAETKFMSEDIFDIVNERDEVIGSAPRSVVHARGLLHRAVQVLVFNARGEIFLQKRSMKKDRQPGVWDSSASGHVDSGEQYDATAVREVREEIGLAVSPPGTTAGTAPVLTRLFKVAACPETDAEFVWIYRCASEGPFTLHPDEIDAGGWFAPAKLTQWMNERPQDFASAFVLIWRKLAA